jgi:hypothetical protein
MTSVKFVLVNSPTNTARYLTPLIFNKEALAILRTYGLINIYLDDYGISKKYTNCLFFLFKLKEDKSYLEFQSKILDFNSFYDYYDVTSPSGSMRMYVFKVHKVYHRDLFSFRHERFDELSDRFLDIADSEVDFSEVKLDISHEIYRFDLVLETTKEDI